MTSTQGEPFISSGSEFTNHSQEYSLSISPRFGKFECNTTSDWRMFSQSEVVLHSNAATYRKIWRIRLRTL